MVTAPVVASLEPAPVIVATPMPVAALPRTTAVVDTSPSPETAKSPVPELPTVIVLPIVHCESAPVTVTRPSLPVFVPRVAPELEAIWPPLEMVMTPRPLEPIVCVADRFQRELMPVTVAVPKPVALLPSVTAPVEETSPPEEIVSVPSPLDPTFVVPVIVHDEPAPLTVAVPSAPRPVPSVAATPALLSLPPLVTLSVPIPVKPTDVSPLMSATAFGPVIVAVPVEPAPNPTWKMPPLIWPLSLRTSVPVPKSPMTIVGRSAAVPSCPPVVTVRNPMSPVVTPTDTSSPAVSTPRMPAFTVNRAVCASILPISTAVALVNVWVKPPRSKVTVPFSTSRSVFVGAAEKLTV